MRTWLYMTDALDTSERVKICEKKDIRGEALNNTDRQMPPRGSFLALKTKNRSNKGRTTSKMGMLAASQPYGMSNKRQVSEIGKGRPPWWTFRREKESFC